MTRNLRRKNKNNLHSFLNTKGDNFDEIRIFAFYVKNLANSKIIRDLKDNKAQLIYNMGIALNTAGANLIDVIKNILTENFTIKNTSKKNDDDDLPEIFDSDDFSWGRFIINYARKTEVKAEKLEKVVFPKLCKKVAEILNKKFDLENFNVANNAAKEVQKFLEISEVELKVMIFFILNENIDSLKNLLRRIPKKIQESLISTAIESPRSAYLEAVASDSKLQKMDIIEKDYHTVFDVDENYSEFILGNSKSFIHKIADIEEPSQVFDMSTFDVKENSKKIILSLLKSKKPCKILLYGKPGAGKTQFAKAIIKKLKKDIISPRKQHENRRSEEKLKKACSCERIAHKLNGIALIDECDNILASKNSFFSWGTDSSDKGDLNIYLDEMKARVFGLLIA